MNNNYLPYPTSKEKKNKFYTIENADFSILHGLNAEPFNNDYRSIMRLYKPFHSFIYKCLAVFQYSVSSTIEGYLCAALMDNDPIEPKRKQRKITVMDVKKNTLKQKVYEQFLKMEGYKDYYEEPEMINDCRYRDGILGRNMAPYYLFLTS